MKSKRKCIEIISLMVILCIIMAVIDGVVMVNYFVKSSIKLALFIGAPLIYTLLRRDISFSRLFVPDKKSIRLALFLCIPLYALIVGGYWLLKDVFDFSGITASLTGNIGVSKDNFIYVSLYISFVNSLLEEFFFRGFGFLTLKKFMTKKLVYIVSPLIFALYHVAMMIGWFSLPLFLLILAGLFAGGFIFDWLDDKTGTLYPSWFVHMFANFGINTVGFILFGIL